MPSVTDMPRAARMLPLVIAVALAGCGDRKPPQAAAGPPPVTVAQPLPHKITDWDEFTGRFEAVQSVELRARVSGYLDQIKFRDGQLVQKGDLLFVIDPRPFQATLDKANADVQREKTRQALAVSELKRAAQLLAARAISQEEYDTRAQAEQESAAAVASATAAARSAGLDLEFTQIRSPISGRIGDRRIDIGNLVSGGTAQSTLLATIVTQDPIYFLFDGSEADFLRYNRLALEGKRGSSRDTPNPVYVRLMDETTWTRKGEMDFVDNRLDPNSGTVRGRAVIPNPGAFLVPGTFGRMRLLGSGEYDALLIPDEAIASDQSHKVVMTVAEDGTVNPKPVELGNLAYGLRVVKSGLAPTDRIIISGLMRARPGAKVTPQPGTFAPAADQ
ncbi:MAG: efflux RND transporter periplasmic adaptor subunit [Azospirillaceae bacterium]|nr:efflux RND transporter periplasmic adaptor subunit [Azospirillaceae bacterium]